MANLKRAAFPYDVLADGEKTPKPVQAPACSELSKYAELEPCPDYHRNRH